MTLKQRITWLRAYVAYLTHSLKYLHTNARGFANITIDFEKWKNNTKD